MALREFNVFSTLESDIQRSNKSCSSGAVDFQREAAFVDEVILGVGKNEDFLDMYAASFTEEYWLFIKKQKLRKRVSLLLTPEDRVDFCQKYFTGISIPPEVLSKYKKNGETSGLLRNHGNELYKQKNLEDALHYYNLALVFAENNSEAVGMAYANRSAVLMELGHIEDALQDVELAFANKYPKALSYKLEQRKNKCEKRILKKQQEYDAVEPQQRNEIETEIQKMKEMRNEMIRVKKSNPLIPAAAESVEIKFDDVQGRHLVVNEDVAPGTVLIAESPYVFTLDYHSQWNLGHCYHCLKRFRRGIPCLNCVFAMYCNESCQANDKIHHLECKCLPSFHVSAAVDQEFRAVRIISKVGPEELFRLFETTDPTYFNPKQPYGTEPGCKYESQSYLSIFHLATNAEKLPLVTRVRFADRAVMTTEILDSKTSFFEDIPSDRKPKFKKFVSSLMLRHIEAVNLNTAYLLDVEGLEGVTTADSYSSFEKLKTRSEPNFGKFAGGLYSVFSLLNHSCDRNVHYLGHATNGTIVVVATRSLKKGEKLFTSYVTGFAQNAVSNRQAKLQEAYHFRCCCTACELKWPTSEELCRQIPTSSCPVCSKEFYEYDKVSKEFRKCVLCPPQWKCDRCGKMFQESELFFSGQAKVELSLKINRILRLNRPRKAFSECLKLVEYFQHHFCAPNVQLYFAQEQLIRALAMIFYFAE